MIELQKITWMPISSEYINSHKSNPPDKRLLPSFLSFVYGTMKNEWIPLDFKENIVYLQNGKYSEAVERNFFYKSYIKEQFLFNIRGFYGNAYVTIKIPNTMISDDVKREFQKIERYAREKGKGLLFQKSYPYSEVFPEKLVSSDLSRYIKNLCNLFIRAEIVPQTDDEWKEVLNSNHFKISTTGNIYVGLPQKIIFEDSGFFPGFKDEYTVDIMVNKNIFSISISGGEAYDNTGFIEEMKPPESKPSVEPLNPEDVEYIHTNQYSDSNGLAVSEESRASWTYIKIRFKKDTGLPVIKQLQQIHIPLTPIKWHICEYRAFNNAYHALIDESVYNRSIENNLCNSQTRKKAYEDMQKNYEKVKDFYLWFSGLKYPKELENVRNQQITALEKLLKDWGVVYKFWERVLEQFPEETERFYKNKARELDEKIKKEFGWTRSNLMKQLQDAGSEELSKIFRKIVLELP